MVTIGSLFSGIGGLELGLEWAGLGPVKWQVEQDPFCRSVLARHWPDVDRFDDVRGVGTELPAVDLVCGGFPCQDVSSAGSGAGLSGAQSGLWFEFARIVGQLVPTWVLVENVASGASRWVDAVRGGLERLGYQTLPVPLSAADVGAPHRRSRVFIVARLADDAAARLGDPHGSGLRRPPRPKDQGRTRSCPGGRFLGDAHSERVYARLRASDSGRSPAAAREARPAAGDVADAVGDGQAEPRHARGPVGDDRARGTDHWPTPWPPPPGAADAWRKIPADCAPALESDLRRVAHGVSAGSHRRRLRALGNAVVPQCAQVVGEIILMLERRHTTPPGHMT